MKDIKACVACLSTDVKLLDIDDCGLRKDFNILIGLHTERGNGLPNYLCLECSTRISGFKKFRTKYRQAYFKLIEILERKNWILLRDIKMIDRKAAGLLSTLSHWSTERAYYEFVNFDEIQHDQNILDKNEIAFLPVYNVTSDNNQCLSHVPLKNDSISERNTNESELEILKIESTLAYEDTNNILKDEPQFEGQKTKDTIKSDISITEDHVYIVDSDVDEACTNGIYNDSVKVSNPLNTNSNEEHGKSVSLTSEEQPVDQIVLLDSDSDKVFSDDDVDHNDYDNDVTNETESYDSDLDEEYARVVPLTTKEQVAAVEVSKLFSKKKYKCEICSKSFNNEEELKLHKRMHDKHEKGYFECELCNYYYRTEFLLQTHMADKHLYKYICKKCPEVNFDRLTAKNHFLKIHLKYNSRMPAEQRISRPNWLRKRNIRKSKGISTNKTTAKLPDDYYITVKIGQLEQYEIIKERKKSINYLRSRFKCELCYRGFGSPTAYEKHLKRHDPEVSGKLMCDMCKLCFRDPKRMYLHVKGIHIYKYCCQLCANICYNSHQAKLHYNWHKNVKYACPHCDKKFSKMSTRLTHIRIAHPSTKLCSICGHSFISDMGLRFHIKNHTKEEVEMSEKNKELATAENKLYCSECKIVFLSDEAFSTHLGSSRNHTSFNKSASVRPYKKRRGRKPRISTSNEIVNLGQVTTSTCTECGEELPSDVQERKHYKLKHPGVALPKRYMCDVCGYTSYLYSNLQVHIIQRHTNEKRHACPICDRRFSMAATRNRHLNVHTGERRYECKHCHRRFAQKSGVKIHIQTVHMKIPYLPWQKRNRKRPKDAEVPLQQKPPTIREARSNYLDAYSAQLF